MKISLPRVVIWDRDTNASSALVEALTPLCREVRLVGKQEEFTECLAPPKPTVDVAVADLATLLTLSAEEIEGLRPSTGSVPLLVASELRPEDYISDVRRLGFRFVLVKVPPIDRNELSIILDSAIDPARGFGLVLHFDQTMEMYSLVAHTKESKNEVIERVINYFATNGFEIHELYDVRLILEELVNNAFYHAFRTIGGEEKYHLGHFSTLEAGETVRIEFGNARDTVGFSVTDNAGTLRPEVILDKLERQYKKHGLYDESGRGLYISRMLATSLFFNIQEGQRTQVVALFRERDRKHRLKPLIINFAPVGSFPPDPIRKAEAQPAPFPPPPESRTQPLSPGDIRDIHEDLD